MAGFHKLATNGSPGGANFGINGYSRKTPGVRPRRLVPVAQINAYV